MSFIISRFSSANETILLPPTVWFFIFFGLIMLDFMDFEIEGFFFGELSSTGSSLLYRYPLRLCGCELCIGSRGGSRFSLLTQSMTAFSCTGVNFELDRGCESFDRLGGDFCSLFMLRSTGELLLMGSPSTLRVLHDTIELSIMAGSRRFFKL